MQREIEEEKRN
jgi:hypothetical protein